MAKATTKEKQVKEPKVIKVSTVVISVLVVIGLIVSFVAGNIYANKHNDMIEEKTLERVSKIELNLDSDE